MKIFMKVRICLILMTIQNIQNSFDPVNKKDVGEMKDKVKGKVISEFLALKSKMYSLVNKNVAKNIRHKEYVDFLFNKYFIRHKIKSKEYSK